MCLNKSKTFLFKKGTYYCAVDAVYFRCQEKWDGVIQKIEKNEDISHIN